MAVQFAVLLVPLLALAGGAVDLGNVFRVRAILTNAADAAAVGSIAQDSPAFIAAEAMSGNGTIAAGTSDATALFNANIGGLTGVPVPTVTPAVSKLGLAVSSQVSWSTTVPMTFLGIIGQGGWAISGTSKATASLPTYLDFYLMIDVSGSMGFPSTSDGQARMQQINDDDHAQYPTGCNFACHYPGNKGYDLSRTNNMGGSPVTSCTTPYIAGASPPPNCIQLRTDAVGMAITQLLSTAAASEQVTNQFRIGLYPFISFLQTNYFPLTTNITATGTSSLSYAAANISTLLDTGSNTTLGSGGTHFENAFPKLNSVITSVGSGISGSPRPFVFLVTDGMQNQQYINYPIGSGWTGSQPAAMDPSLCSQLKSRGVTIEILYIPYQPIVNPVPGFANNEDIVANKAIPDIPTDLQTCATSGDFYTANTPQDITNALNAMFNQALSTARITN